MRHRKWLAAALVASAAAASLSLSACARPVQLGEASTEAAQVEPVQGTGLSRVTLSAQAVARLGIRTEPVGKQRGTGITYEVIPYAAVLYDATGGTWAYTSSAGRTFVRQSIAIDHVGGAVAYLRAGPAPGTAVVTVGAAELFGAEHGVGGE